MRLSQGAPRPPESLKLDNNMAKPLPTDNNFKSFDPSRSATVMTVDVKQKNPNFTNHLLVVSRLVRSGQGDAFHGTSDMKKCCLLHLCEDIINLGRPPVPISAAFCHSRKNAEVVIF